MFPWWRDSLSVCAEHCVLTSALLSHPGPAKSGRIVGLWGSPDSSKCEGEVREQKLAGVLGHSALAKLRCDYKRWICGYRRSLNQNIAPHRSSP